MTSTSFEELWDAFADRTPTPTTIRQSQSLLEELRRTRRSPSPLYPKAAATMTSPGRQATPIGIACCSTPSQYPVPARMTRSDNPPDFGGSSEASRLPLRPQSWDVAGAHRQLDGNPLSDVARLMELDESCAASDHGGLSVIDGMSMDSSCIDDDMLMGKLDSLARSSASVGSAASRQPDLWRRAQALTTAVGEPGLPDSDKAVASNCRVPSPIVSSPHRQDSTVSTSGTWEGSRVSTPGALSSDDDDPALTQAMRDACAEMKHQIRQARQAGTELELRLNQELQPIRGKSDLMREKYEQLVTRRRTHEEALTEQTRVASRQEDELRSKIQDQRAACVDFKEGLRTLLSTAAVLDFRSEEERQTQAQLAVEVEKEASAEVQLSVALAAACEEARRQASEVAKSVVGRHVTKACAIMQRSSNEDAQRKCSASLARCPALRQLVADRDVLVQSCSSQAEQISTLSKAMASMEEHVAEREQDLSLPPLLSQQQLVVPHRDAANVEAVVKSTAAATDAAKVVAAEYRALKSTHVPDAACAASNAEARLQHIDDTTLRQVRELDQAREDLEDLRRHASHVEKEIAEQDSHLRHSEENVAALRRQLRDGEAENVREEQQMCQNRSRCRVEAAQLLQELQQCREDVLELTARRTRQSQRTWWRCCARRSRKEQATASSRSRSKPKGQSQLAATASPGTPTTSSPRAVPAESFRIDAEADLDDVRIEIREQDDETTSPAAESLMASMPHNGIGRSDATSDEPNPDMGHIDNSP